MSALDTLRRLVGTPSAPAAPAAPASPAKPRALNGPDGTPYAETAPRTWSRAQLASAQRILDDGGTAIEAAKAMHPDGRVHHVADLVARSVLTRTVAQRVPRRCLNCQAAFTAPGRFVRLCGTCR